LIQGSVGFRTVYVEVPRKCAKSTISSGVGLYLLTEDAEEGAEVYSAATTRDQARIVFADAQAMARRTPDLREYYGLAVNAHNINVVRTSSKFEALSSEGDTLDGLNVHGAIIDELHAHKTRAVWDVIETATGSREQSLLWAITTAGSNRTGICYEQRTYVTKLLENVFQDETYFGVIYTIDDDDAWEDERSWRKANPNYGVSVMADDFARLAQKAMQTPSAVNNFLTKRLNVWVNADVGLFDMQAWEACGDHHLRPEDFAGHECWMAVDLGFVDDIAAVMKMFKIERENEPAKWAFFGRYYLPEETIESSRNAQYAGWHRMGRITATDGNVTDTERIIDDLAEDLGRYRVRELCFDPYNKLSLLNPMERRGVAPEVLVEFPQTVPMMSPATEALMKAVRSRQVIHDGCPVMAWAMSNVVGKFDAKGNVYPRKERPENKIDPAIAAIMAFGRASMIGESQTISYVSGSLGSVV
jgi:phage terminase large subunit-like protein